MVADQLSFRCLSQQDKRSSSGRHSPLDHSLGLQPAFGNSGVLRRITNTMRFPAKFTSEMLVGEALGRRQQSAPVPLDGALDSSIPQLRDEEQFPSTARGRMAGKAALWQSRFISCVGSKFTQLDFRVSKQSLGGNSTLRLYQKEEISPVHCRRAQVGTQDGECIIWEPTIPPNPG